MFLQQRTLIGTSFGGGHQRTDVLPMLIDLFMEGRYRLRELISRRMPLSEINEAVDLLRQAELERSAIVDE